MKIPIEHTSSNNAQEAMNRAQIANNAAKSGRTARDIFNAILGVLDEWSRIFVHSPVGILTAFFFFAVLMEIFFSWPMYEDIMSQITGRGNAFLSLTGALFIVLWGAYCSHLIAKKMSRAVFNYTVTNEMRSSRGTIPQAAAVEKAQILTHRDLLKGVIFGTLLLLVVTAISWNRVWLQGAISGRDYGLIQKLLPVVCVLVEIISGLYLGYLLRRLIQAIKAKRLQKQFTREKDLCAYETKMCHEHYQKALADGEKIHYSLELRDTLYRYEHRSQDGDNYLDPIPELKTLKVIVCNETGPQADVHLAGILANGEYCNSIWTDLQGEGVLAWDGNAREVSVIYADNEEHMGPFRENSTVRIILRRRKQLKNLPRSGQES